MSVTAAIAIDPGVSPGAPSVAAATAFFKNQARRNDATGAQAREILRSRQNGGESDGGTTDQPGGAGSAGVAPAIAFREALGIPPALTVDGVRIIVAEPTVGALKRALLRLPAGSVASEAALNATVASLVPAILDLILGCLQWVDGGAPEGWNASDSSVAETARREWFDGLKYSDGVAILDAFLEVVDLAKLMRPINALREKLAAVGITPPTATARKSTS